MKTETYNWQCPTTGQWFRRTRLVPLKPVTKVVEAARDAAEAKADAEAETEAAAITKFGRNFRTKQKLGW